MYLSDYESLVDNAMWVEIVRTLEEVKVGLLEDLKELDPSTEATALARQQGRLKMVEFVLSMPEDIKHEMEQMIKKSKEESEVEEDE